MKQKGFTSIILVIVVIIIAGAVGYFALVKKSPQLVQEKTSTPTDEIECAQKLTTQREYLKNDTLATTETFEKYPVNNILQTTPTSLNTSSNKFANEFRTKILEELASKGVNFAGNYSLISVGMTGWGQNYFIIDRKNGHAYLFPYFAESLEFKKDSNLIVMNPKSAILDLTKKDEYNTGGCYFLNQQFSTELRSFYFLWENNQLILIGPKDITPPPNKFWTEYF